MMQILTPNGLKANVPESLEEDDTPRFNFNEDSDKAINYYNKYGYVIFSKCISIENCIQLKNLWDKNIKPYKGKIYRQTTAKAEINQFNDSLVNH